VKTNLSKSERRFERAVAIMAHSTLQDNLRSLRLTYPRSVNGKSWIEAKEADLVRDAAKSLDAEPSPSG
jgi:hypothetical protein